MRFRLNSQWPVQGGCMVIPPSTVIDDTSPLSPHWNSVVSGVIPPPDVTPLNQATRDWLVAAYYGYPVTILPVGSG